jgi:hypothetical protein
MKTRHRLRADERRAIPEPGDYALTTFLILKDARLGDPVAYVM